MAEAIAFANTTSRYELPLLFAGQAQKELTVNEASSRVDALLHPAISGVADDGPASPDEGETWLVGSGSGAWFGHAGDLAIYAGGNWLFVKPRAGLRVYDKTAKAARLFDGTAWRIAARPSDPSGGSNIDTQARAAIVGIYGILATVGLIPPN